MTRVRFEKVILRGTRLWKENGKRRQETRKFFQTINPYNKNAAGEQKSKSEILVELINERAKWLADAQENQ